MDKKLDFNDVLIVPKYSTVKSRNDVNLEKKFQFNNNRSFTAVPIIAANMHNIGTNKVAEIMREHCMSAALMKGEETIHNTYSYTFETYGIKEKVNPVPLICLDVANGYMQDFITRVMVVKQENPNSIIMAGNVATSEGAFNLASAGADIIKVGLGSGEACITRQKTGIGYPQLAAVLECVTAVSDFKNTYICSDGGHRTPGDIAKSFVAGADFVMLGGMLAGTKETGSFFCGNASNHIRVSNKEYITEEGIIINKPPSDKPLSNVLKDIAGGLRSTCSYVGAHSLEELHTKGRFVRIR